MSIVKVKLVEVVPSSEISFEVAVIIAAGSSSLTKFKDSSRVSKLVPDPSSLCVANNAFVKSAATKLNRIVSIPSIVSSSTAVMLTDPLDSPAAIVTSVVVFPFASVTVYCPASAVPAKVNGIVISCALIACAVIVAVSATELAASVTANADSDIETETGSSLSIIVTVTAASVEVAFTAVPGVTIIVSSASSI